MEGVLMYDCGTGVLRSPVQVAVTRPPSASEGSKAEESPRSLLGRARGTPLRKDALFWLTELSGSS
jgi:hypothetical protein